MPRPRAGLVMLVLVAIVMLGFTAAGLPKVLRDPVAPAPTATSSGLSAVAQPSRSPSATKSASTAKEQISLYYLNRTGRLQREMRDLPVHGDRVRTAVSALLNVAPLDPDYYSAWATGVVNSVHIGGGLITVDLSRSAFARIQTADEATLALQQLVYTASDAAGPDPDSRQVRVTVDSKPLLPGLNAQVDAMPRTGVMPLAYTWLISPRQDGALASGPVELSGFIRADASTGSFRITDIGAQSVMFEVAAERSGDEMGWHLVQAAVTLPPGRYEVVLTASNGTTDDKVFQVR